MAQTLYLRLSQNPTMRKGRRNIPAAGDLPGDSASARYLAFYTVCLCCAKAFNHTYEVLFTRIGSQLITLPLKRTVRSRGTCRTRNMYT